jgi:hypothetical protein
MRSKSARGAELRADRVSLPLRVPELADPLGAVEVAKHKDVKEFGAGSRTEGVQTCLQSALKLVRPHAPRPVAPRWWASRQCGHEPARQIRLDISWIGFSGFPSSSAAGLNPLAR